MYDLNDDSSDNEVRPYSLARTALPTARVEQHAPQTPLINMRRTSLSSDTCDLMFRVGQRGSPVPHCSLRAFLTLLSNMRRKLHYAPQTTLMNLGPLSIIRHIPTGPTQEEPPNMTNEWLPSSGGEESEVEVEVEIEGSDDVSGGEGEETFNVGGDGASEDVEVQVEIEADTEVEEEEIVILDATAVTEKSLATRTIHVRERYENASEVIKKAEKVQSVLQGKYGLHGELQPLLDNGQLQIKFVKRPTGAGDWYFILDGTRYRSVDELAVAFGAESKSKAKRLKR